GPGVLAGADDRHPVQERRIGRIGPGLRRPPGGPRQHVDPLGAKSGQPRLQRLDAGRPCALVIAAQGDDDCVIQIRRRFGRVVPGVHFLDHSDGLIFFMTDHPDDRIALFIDGANLYSAARALNCDLDFKKLPQRFTGEGRLIRAYYYTAVIEGEEFSPIRPLVDWLDYNGFTVVTKPVKR